MKKSELRKIIQEEILNESKMVDKIYVALKTIPEFDSGKVGADTQGDIVLAVEKLFKKYGIK